MLLSEQELEQAIGVALGLTVRVAVAETPLGLGRMTAGELARFHNVAGGPRQDSWLRGRAALKRLLGRLGEPEDTSDLAFPNRRLSLTHSGPYAVAVGVQGGEQSGVGVDLEWGRPMPLESSRYFLSQSERLWLNNQDLPVSATHLRLWTVKEALFKADPGNRSTGLLDYLVEDPAAAVGCACSTGERPFRMRYASLAAGDGFLTVAVALGKALGKE